MHFTKKKYETFILHGLCVNWLFIHFLNIFANYLINNCGNENRKIQILVGGPNVLHLNSEISVAHWRHCPKKVEMKFLKKKIGLSLESNFHYLESWKLTGVECWDQCPHGGKCSICGESGYCCRNEDTPSWNKDCPTGAIQAAWKDRHQCVALKQGSL